MIFDGHEYVYGTYDFETEAEKKYVNELAKKISQERGCQTYVKAVE